MLKKNFGKNLVGMCITSSLIMSLCTPVMNAAGDEVSIVGPVDGDSIYHNHLTLVVSQPESANVTYTLDGSPITGFTESSDGLYRLGVEGADLYLGDHTFTVSDGTNTDTVDFKYFGSEYTFLDLDFDDLSAEATTFKGIVAGVNDAKVDITPDSSTLSLVNEDGNNSMRVYKTITAAGDTFPGMIINTNNLFNGFGSRYNSDKSTWVSAEGYRSGVVETEFDIKMNELSTFAFHGTGYGGNADTAKNNGQLINSSGQFRLNTNAALTKGNWHHIKIVADETNGVYAFYLDGVFVYSSTTEDTNYFGTKVQSSSQSRLQLQSYINKANAVVDYQVDNIKIKYRNETQLANSTFDKYGTTAVYGQGIATDLNQPINNNGGTVEAVQGTTEDVNDKAIHLVPANESDDLGYRFFLKHSGQNALVGGTLTEGHVLLSADIKADSTDCTFRLPYGLGFNSNITILANGKFLDTVNCEIGKWYHLDMDEDIAKKIAKIYVDGIYAGYLPLPDTALKHQTSNGYYVTINVKRTNGETGGISVDNFKVDYVNAIPEISTVGYKTTGDEYKEATVIKSGSGDIQYNFHKAFDATAESTGVKGTAADYSDVEVNGSAATAENVTFSGNSVNVKLSDASVAGEKQMLAFDKMTYLTNTLILGKDYKVSVDVADKGFRNLKVTEDGEGNATATVEAFLDDEDNEVYEFIIADYEANGETFVKTVIQPIEVANDTPYGFKTYNVPMEEIDNGHTVKAFVWTAEEITPQLNAVSVQ